MSTRKLNKTTYRNMKFLGVALILVFTLLALVAGLMKKQPQNSQAEVKQKEYNNNFDSLTPSTSYVDRSTNESDALDSISIDDLDSEFVPVDEDINQL